MPGLLDIFNTPEGMQGLSLLAAAGPSMEPQNFASRLASAQNSYRGMQRGLLQDKLMNAQIDNFTSEAEARKAGLAKTQALLDLFKPAAAVPGGSMMTTQPGQLGSGSFGVVPPPAGAGAFPAAPASGGSRIGSLTPDKLAQLKLLGVDMTDVYKLTQPDWQVSNGFAFNKNDPNFRGGFMPQVNVSQNGQATQVVPDGNGGVSVRMPQGSLEAYSAFRNADEAAKAGSDLVKVVGPDGAERYVSRAQVLGTTPPNQPAARLDQAGPANPGRAVPLTQPGDADRAAIFDQEMRAAQQRLANAKTPEEQNRARTDIAALNREISALPKSAQPSGFQATPTTAQAAEAAAAKVRAEATARAEVERQTGRTKKSDSATDMLDNIQRARTLLQMSPTGSMGGAAVDKVMSWGGMTTPSANVANSLETLSGWLTSNTPRMEGPQSNTDVENYKIMAGRVGDRTIPAEARLAALGEVERIQKKYAHLNGEQAVAQQPATQKTAQTLDSLPKTATRGARVRDTQTGEILTFNGLSWVKEK